MKRQKKLKTLLFVLLGFVILCSVILPATLTSYGERKLLDRVGIVEDKRETESEAPSAEEKLKLISDHASGTRPVTLTEQKNIISSGGENAILSAAVAELKKLSNAGLMPAVSSDTPATDLTCSAATYIDPENSALRVTVWKMKFSADGYVIEIWMDAETHTVLCISFENTDFYLSPSMAQSLCNAWGSYMGISPDSAELTDDGFSAGFAGVPFRFTSVTGSVSICISDCDF